MESSNPKGSFSSSRGDSAEFETELTLSDRLKAFKSNKFDPEGYVGTRCRGMSEKEIRHLCNYLVDLKKASAEEMRKNVYANYSAFIRTAREISDLEGQLISLRNLLSTRATLVHGLTDGVRSNSLSSNPEASTKDDIFNFEDREPSEIEKWSSKFTENLEVLLAERRVDEALNALDEGEHIAKEAHRQKTLTPSAFSSLQTTISQHRQKLADQLAETTRQPSICGVELRSNIQALKQLGDGPRAHSLLLESHHRKLQNGMKGICPSGTSYGVAYTSSLSQLVFSTISLASSDSLAIFGEEPAYSSELVTWAVKQTDAFAHLVIRHVLGSPAASGGLRVVAECVQISLGHCSLLEACGLALSPVLLKHFKPCVEQALRTNLKRIEQTTAALAAADDWSLVYQQVGVRSLSTMTLGGAIGSQLKLSTSAHRFNTVVQQICEDMGPLESLQLSSQASEGLFQVFKSYINMLINALPGSMETENIEGSSSRIVRTAETESQQVALLANALMLADELLPRALLKLSGSRIGDNPGRQNRNPEQREMKRKLQRLVDRLRDSFCRQHALDLIFMEDGSVWLNAEMYLSLDDNMEEPEWFPSPIYQELFVKLNRIATIASDMFVGRERFATMLLMRLTETVILWISDDQSFWEEIEEGPRPLAPWGLQQFYLDMEFVILFSSDGRYLSRNLHQVIKNIIGRAIEAVAATRIDPYSVLPDDEWFADVAQIAIKVLTGKAKFESMDQDAASPTLSNSAQSESIYSHGSN